MIYSFEFQQDILKKHADAVQVVSKVEV